MEFGVAFPSRVTDHDLVVLAEELGYDQAWFYDSQMIYSDVYATMALAAYRTTRIRLGTGVAVSLTRLAPTIAHSIATINALAPGRTELGIGVGNTAQLTMGIKPASFSRLRSDTRLIRRLLDGETGILRDKDGDHAVRFLHPEHGFLNLRDRIPITLSAFGPKGMEFCGAELDGHMVWSLAPHVLQMCRAAVGASAEAAGRSLADIPLKGIYPTAVLHDGETSASPRILHSVAPFMTNALHFLVEWGKNVVPVPPEAEDAVAGYAAYVEALPAETRHLILHEGHLIYAREDEQPFLTPELAAAVASIGTPAELMARIHALEEAGLSHYAIQATDDPEGQLRDFADHVMAPYHAESA